MLLEKSTPRKKQQKKKTNNNNNNNNKTKPKNKQKKNTQKTHTKKQTNKKTKNKQNNNNNISYNLMTFVEVNLLTTTAHYDFFKRFMMSHKATMPLLFWKAVEIAEETQQYESPGHNNNNDNLLYFKRITHLVQVPV